MNSCFVRYYGNLKELTGREKRERHEILFNGSPGIKDVVESEGVPHTEVGLIIVNSLPAEWQYRLKDGDDCAVYPFFRDLDIRSVSRLPAQDYPEGRFVLDIHLGSLCKYLRMLGFDCYYNSGFKDRDIITVAKKESRFILTRDRGILKNGAVLCGCLIRSIHPLEQLHQVLERFGLYSKIRPLIRCLKCNGVIESIPSDSVTGMLPENTKKYYHDFYRCVSCGTIYWKGSHYENMIKMIEGLFALIL